MPPGKVLQAGPLLLQSGTKLKVSPITAFGFPPAALIPGLKIDPSALTNGWQGGGGGVAEKLPQPAGLSGSEFGTMMGFTQRGCTGTKLPLEE